VAANNQESFPAPTEADLAFYVPEGGLHPLSCRYYANPASIYESARHQHWHWTGGYISAVSYCRTIVAPRL